MDSHFIVVFGKGYSETSEITVLHSVFGSKAVNQSTEKNRRWVSNLSIQTHINSANQVTYYA